MSSRPLKNDKPMISDIVPTATPTIEIMEMTLMKFFFFLERKYFLAMKSGRFNLVAGYSSGESLSLGGGMSRLPISLSILCA